MQEGSWDELQFEYWLNLPKFKNKKLSEDEKEIFDSYQFFIHNRGVPCLATNIGFYSEKFRRFAYKFPPGYLKQELRCPYRLVGWYDEIGTVFNPQLCHDKGDKQKSLEMADMSRYCRQFCELRFIGTEQDPSNVYINLRRVVGLNRLYTEFKLIGKPRFLKWIYNKLKSHFTKHMSVVESRLFSGFMSKFFKFYRAVGYFKIKFNDIANTETGALTTNEGFLYFPCATEFKYETRAFRRGYLPRHKNIFMECYDDLSLSEDEAIKFLRASYKNSNENPDS